MVSLRLHELRSPTHRWTIARLTVFNDLGGVAILKRWPWPHCDQRHAGAFIARIAVRAIHARFSACRRIQQASHHLQLGCARTGT